MGRLGDTRRNLNSIKVTPCVPLVFDPLRGISGLEQAYRRALGRAAALLDRGLLPPHKIFDGPYTRLTRRISSLERHLPAGAADLKELLSEYQKDLQRIHQQNILWLSLYYDLQPPEAAAPVRDRDRRRIGRDARALWEELAGKAARSAWPDERQRDIFLQKQRAGRLEADTSPWRLAYARLAGQVRRYARTVLLDSRYALQGRFRLVLARWAHERPARGLSPVGKGLVDGMSRPPDLTLVSDWLRGYYPPSRRIRAWYGRAAGPVTAGLRRAAFARGRKVLLAAVLVLLVAGAGMKGMRDSDAGRRFWRALAFEVKCLFHLDHDARVARAKQEYFRRQIAAIGQNYSPEEVRQRIRDFYDDRIYQRKDAALYFSRNILKGFFLLLSDYRLDPDLKTEVVGAAAMFDPRLARTLRHMTGLFGRPTIAEKTLRDDLLQLRRELVPHQVFPFTFIVLERDVPYVFLFPEPVLHRYIMTAWALGKLHLDERQVARSSLWPVVAYVVDGGHYPFADRAGYFEGEFAVVFRRFSPDVEWTVYHEVGHVVDHLENVYDGRPLPDNVELHAMLGPVIWARDRKAYVATRLVDETRKKDPYDRYAQAAKGVLNGLSLYLSERAGVPPGPPITDAFEPGRVRRDVALVRAADNEVLHNAGYALYNDSKKYLATAEPGRYISYVTDFREVIYGTGHKIARRGYILDGPAFLGVRGGPRLIFDNSGDSDLGGGFHPWAFLGNVLSIILFGSRSRAQATNAEAAAAAGLVFVLFNAAAFVLHRAGGGYRKRMFHGRPASGTMDRVYRARPGAGRSFGPASGATDLLRRVFAAGGAVDPSLKAAVAAYKATAPDRERLLFDLCLFLSPFQPRRSRIFNKAHDLLFFLPFLGPCLGRAPWLWRVQALFHRREEFNAALEHMIRRLPPDTGLPGAARALRAVLARFGQQPAAAAALPASFREGGDFPAEVTSLVLGVLAEPGPAGHLNIQFLRDQVLESNEPSVEFDRLEPYTPGDDIRHIDWKSTARYAATLPMVRRFSRPYGAKVVLWLDMRFLHDPEGRRRWAEDFSRAIRMLHLYRQEVALERLIFVGPGGKLSDYPLRLTAENDLGGLAARILSRVRERYAVLMAGRPVLDVAGLSFYDEEENRRYVRQLMLSDLMRGSEPPLELKPLKEKKMNIFVVGVKMNEKNMVERLAGEENRVHHW